MVAWPCRACRGENPGEFRFCGHCGAPRERESGRPAPADAAPQLLGEEGLKLADAVMNRFGDDGLAQTGEHRWVTAVFVDVSGFTSLAESVEPERLMEIIDPVMARVREVVNRYEGYVAKYLGDAVLAFFGAPVAHEDDATRALLAALEIRQEFTRLLPGLPAEGRHIELHIGVNTGRVVSGHAGQDLRLETYSILGDSVNVAQRLEAAAPPGEIYVGEATHRLTEHAFDFEPVGELVMKGKAQPVRAWRLHRQHATADQLRRRGGGESMVGRDHELRHAAEALGRLRSGEGGITSLVGEAGMGKSLLLRSLRSLPEARDVGWLEARCVSYGNELAYWPYADLVRTLYGIRPEDPAEVALGQLEEALTVRGLGDAVDYFAVLVGLKKPEEIGIEPEAVKRRLHQSLARALRQRAEANPVVLVVEDLHWIDEASRSLTADLIREIPDLPLHVILTGRPEARATIDLLRAAAPGVPSSEVILVSLPEESVEVLLEASLGARPAPGLTSFFQQRTLGNPFFVEELARSLREGGQLTFDAGAWAMTGTADTLALPPTVEGVIAARLDRLPGIDLAVLQVASVVGRRPRLPLLKLAADLRDVDGALSRLVQTNFLAPVDDEPAEFVTFPHALVHEVTYSRMLGRDRREAHRRVANAALRLYGDGDDFIDITAHHLYLAEAGVEAHRALVRAAKKSQRLFANQETIIHLQHALEIARVEDGLSAEISVILLDIARLQERVGTYERALETYGELRDRTGQVEAWQGLAAVLRKRGDGEAALGVIDEGFARVREAGQDPRPLWLEQAWCLGAIKSRYDETVRALEAGLREAPGRGDLVEGYLMVQLARVEAVTGNLEAALAHARGGESVFASLEDLPGLANTLQVMGGIEHQAGLCPDALGTLRRALALAERVGAPEEIAGCLINLGVVEADCGSLEAAISCLRRAIEDLERIGKPNSMAIARANLAEKLLAAGEIEEALVQADLAVELAEAIENTFTLADGLATRAEILLGMERAEEAMPCAARAGELFEELGIRGRAAAAFGIAAGAADRSGSAARASEMETRAARNSQ